jgi:endoglucanase
MKKIFKILRFVVFTAIIGFTLIGANGVGGDDVIQGTPAAPRPFRDISAAQLVSEINIGWNLGNTLDVRPGDGLSSQAMQETSVSQFETMWSNPVTTETMIATIKNAGFNAIRIPVTWFKVADTNFNIRADWMARVIEIVNYAVNNDMYIILNTHHDERIFKFTNSQKAQSLNAFRRIWEQIADTFRNYDEKLIFEGLNEPRTIGVSHEWTGGNNEERINLNEYYQVFVDTVRASGGNNGRRILMVTTYGASAEQAAINGLTIPADPANTINKIIVSVHSYSPFSFAHELPGQANWHRNNSQDTRAITVPINLAYDRFVRNGIPVIIGEFGSRSEKAEAPRSAWAEFYVSHARSKGIPCFLWDDGGWFRFFNRRDGTFYAPQVLRALMNGASGPRPAVIEPRRR